MSFLAISLRASLSSDVAMRTLQGGWKAILAPCGKKCVLTRVEHQFQLGRSRQQGINTSKFQVPSCYPMPMNGIGRRVISGARKVHNS